jgi:hypothetical protein
MYGVMQNIRESAFPEADGIRALTTILGTVRSVTGAQETMRIMLSALNTLEHDATREHAIKSLIAFPPTPDQE